MQSLLFKIAISNLKKAKEKEKMRVCPDSDLRAFLFMDYFDKTAEEIRQGYPVLTNRQEVNGIFSSNGYQNSFLVRSVVENMFTAAEMGWLHAVLFLVNSLV